MTIAARLAQLYADQSRRMLATLVRWLGDIDRAEDALQAAFEAALVQWTAGVPERPAAWLLTTARNKGIDRLRAQRNASADLDMLPATESRQHEDDPLRLLFVCCHPLLPLDNRVALALRTVCGLSVPEIARAFLVTPATMKRRITRAKAMLRDRQVPYRVPTATELDTRLDAVLQVIYLVFNEGHTATSGAAHIRQPLVAHALHLGRLLARLLPASEAIGLLAMMCLHAARMPARLDAQGEIVPLEAQNRRLWRGDLLSEGHELTLQALTTERPGPYALQAAIASVHMAAPAADATDWRIIVGYYDRLLAVRPSPVVALNRAIAMGMRDGPLVGLAHLNTVTADGSLAGYAAAHMAKGDMAARAGRTDTARAAFEIARELVRSAPERRCIEHRLATLRSTPVKKDVPICAPQTMLEYNSPI